jgi:hypothetical protein
MKICQDLGTKLGIDDKFRRHNVKKRNLKISFENMMSEIDMKTGKSEIVSFLKHQSLVSPVDLHKTLLISGFIIQMAAKIPSSFALSGTIMVVNLVGNSVDGN